MARCTPESIGQECDDKKLQKFVDFIAQNINEDLKDKNYVKACFDFKFTKLKP